MKVFAQILGYLGTACLVASFQCKKEKELFYCQLMSGILFVFHYGLCGDFTGMAMDFMAFLRAVFMASGKKKLTGKPMMFAIIGVLTVLCVVTWEDVFSLCPMIALIASTVALYTGVGDKIRIVQLVTTSPFWMIYNVHVMSLPGIICEALDMLSVIVFFAKEKMAEMMKEE